ncbi:hypothetical protein L2755_20755 [Shewanella abyssi]|uniref:hypothetical protein n=1 Tax=Shewanella abyssi TaxID=311789 RepID=UPI00200BBE7B|nr:hypothetical protein [Shewanella abyssi]MCL1052028.1 hypothetical protein [Shewanella abyssi]
MWTKFQNYYNSKALLHILLLVVLYFICDTFIIDYKNDENAFSQGFYFKLLLSIFYLIGSKEKQSVTQEDNSIDAAFHFSVLVLCLWMGLTTILMESVSISRFTGLFLIFGSLSAFNLIDELLKLVRVKIQSGALSRYAIETTLKIILFATFCFALFFLITGEWVWEIKPFYEW